MNKISNTSLKQTSAINENKINKIAEGELSKMADQYNEAGTGNHIADKELGRSFMQNMLKRVEEKSEYIKKVKLE